MNRYFVTGVGTDVGKTVAAAVLVEQLEADYWKPIQCGDLHNSDSIWIANHIANTKTIIHPETYRFKGAFSPHKSADLEDTIIDLNSIKLPLTDNPLIIEGAGGLMVPLNRDTLMIDLIKKLNCEVILVSQNYLGSINHTLLSLFALKEKGIQFKGMIINGAEDIYTEEIYFLKYKIPFLGRIPKLDLEDKDSIKKIKLSL